ncbi:MAG: cobalt ECF transporter T component CbiQ [Anaerolineae bacterium]|nr:cobalt ECF transporter T component CbiQ [Anaerolineae bacterium]
MPDHPSGTGHPLQQLDARVKIIFTLAFILALSLSPFGAWAAYFLFLCLVLSAAIAAGTDLRSLLRRSLLGLLFILSALPLLFTAPGIRLPLHLGGWTLWISQPGLIRFASIGAKAWISMLAALLLAESTPVPVLLLAFQRLRTPRVFIAILSLMWRYLSVIRAEALSLMHARTSRSAASPDGARGGGGIAWRARVTGGMAGSLLLRSMERADRVYAAMLSRGYDGQLPDPERKGLSPQDLLVLAGALLLILFFLLFALFTGGLP